MYVFSAERGFLEDLPPALLSRLHKTGRKRRFAKGTLIHSHGQPATSIYVVISGALLVSRFGRKGARTTTVLLGEGEPLGLLTMLSGRPRSHDLHAAADCELLVISRSALLQLLEKEPQLRDHIIALLAARLAWALETVEDLKRLPASARLAKLLLERGNAEGLLRMTQEEVGEELGISRNAVNNALRTLTVNGAAKSTYGGIQILDRRALQVVTQNDR